MSPHPDGSTVRRAILRAAVLCMCAAVAYGQATPGSPVFKKYRPPPDPPLIEPSDALYQIWETFLVTRKANAGDMLAQHELGLRYLFGRGAAPDTVKAALWIKKAADQGYVPARFNEAILSYHGWGLPWDPFAAYKDFFYCAERKMPEAEFAMAQFLTEDLVVPRNDDSALVWIRSAADSGYAPAKEALARLEKQRSARNAGDTLHARGGPSNPGLVFLDIPADTSAAMSDSLLLREAIRTAGPALRRALGMSKLLEGELATDSATMAGVRQAADAGSPEALTLLGRAHEKGTGVPRDAVKACAYYVRALRVDSPRAGELLWNLLQEKGAIAHITTAAAAGNPEARFAWAEFSALGFDAALMQAHAFITPAQAFQMLAKSADDGFLPSVVDVGLCYYAGRWIPQNMEKAVAAWKDAAGRGSLDAKVRLALTSLRTPEDSAGREAAPAVLAAAAEQGSVLAEFGLGYCFETGTGVLPKKAEAARYYRAASVRGSQDAYRALRRMHDAVRPGDAEFTMPD